MDSLGSKKGLGRRFGVLVALYMLSTFIAALCAVVGSFLFPVTLQLTEVSGGEAAVGSLSEVFTNLLTWMLANPIAAVANANYIAILFWAIVTGLALKKIASQATITAIHELADVVSMVV